MERSIFRLEIVEQRLRLFLKFSAFVSNTPRSTGRSLWIPSSDTQCIGGGFSTNYDLCFLECVKQVEHWFAGGIQDILVQVQRTQKSRPEKKIGNWFAKPPDSVIWAVWLVHVSLYMWDEWSGGEASLCLYNLLLPPQGQIAVPRNGNIKNLCFGSCRRGCSGKLSPREYCWSHKHADACPINMASRFSDLGLQLAIQQVAFHGIHALSAAILKCLVWNSSSGSRLSVLTCICFRLFWVCL